MKVGRKPTYAIKALIRSHSTTYTFVRPTITLSDARERQETTTQISVDAYLHTPFEMTEQMVTGERTEITLMGHTLPSADVQINDEVDYGGRTYVVAEVREMPTEANVQYKVLYLERHYG